MSIAHVLNNFHTRKLMYQSVGFVCPIHLLSIFDRNITLSFALDKMKQNFLTEVSALEEVYARRHLRSLSAQRRKWGGGGRVGYVTK